MSPKQLRLSRVFVRKWTISELSQAAKIERSDLMAYEYGYKMPTKSHLKRLNVVLFGDARAYYGQHKSSEMDALIEKLNPENFKDLL